MNIPIHIIENQMHKIIEHMEYGLSEQQMLELAKRTIVEGMAFIRVTATGSIELCDPYLELETTGI